MQLHEQKQVTMANPENAAVETASEPVAEAEEEPERVVSTQVKEEAPPAYSPNFKFKVQDEEKEFDEFVRGSIKDQETEGKFRELYEKAHGLDHVKPKLAEERTQREQREAELAAIRSEYGQYNEAVNEILELKDKDLGMFLQRLQLDPKKLANYLADVFETQDKLKDLPEPFRNMYNEFNNLRSEVQTLRKATGNLNQTHTGSLVQARTNELTQHLGSPEVKSLVEQYDARVGKPGMFATMVMRHGKAVHDETGQDLSVAEAASEVMKLLGLQSQVAGQAATPNAVPTPGATTGKVVTHQKPTVLPKVGGSGGTPASSRPKSTEDLRKLYRAMTAEG